MPIEKTDKIWMDGTLVDWDDAKIHVLSHTLHYGSGVFEGIRAYATADGPAVFRLNDHIRRLFDSAHLFLMDIPYSAEEIVEACKETVRVNGLESCYVRPIAFLGYGEIGLNPLPCPVNVSIAVWPWGSYLGEESLNAGVRVMVSSWRRMDPNVNPIAAKGTGIYINSSLAKIEAIKSGYDEAVMLNTQGFVAECTGENIFIVKDGVLITPTLSSGALGGITRDSVMTIARDLGYEVREDSLLAPRPLPRRRGVPHRHRRRARADPVGRRSRDRSGGRDHAQAPGDLLRRRAGRGGALPGLVGLCPRLSTTPHRTGPSGRTRVGRHASRSTTRRCATGRSSRASRSPSTTSCASPSSSTGSASTSSRPGSRAPTRRTTSSSGARRAT